MFLDGVGLAAASATNPLATTPMPALRRLLGGSLTTEWVQQREGLLLAGLDACLGVDGLPQSVTGQTTLFSGVNAARVLGRHTTGFLGPRLREVVEKQGLLRRARERGLAVTFANAYLEPPPGGKGARRRRASVTTTAALAAGIALRGRRELAAGEAVSWDIVRDRYRALAGDDVPAVTADLAGSHLAALAFDHDLTLFETFLTDLAAHGRWGLEPADVLARVDALLGGVLAAGGGDLTLLVTSDHGNLEDARTRVHTRNEVPLLVAGPLAERFAGCRSLADVTPRILECLARPLDAPS